MKKTAKLMFKIQMDMGDDFAVEILRKVSEGFVNTVSVGFLPTEWKDLDPDDFWGGREYTKQDLLELSFVPVPANPEAVLALKSMSKKDTRFAPVQLEQLFPQQQNSAIVEEKCAPDDTEVEEAEVIEPEVETPIVEDEETEEVETKEVENGKKIKEEDKPATEDEKETEADAEKDVTDDEDITEEEAKKETETETEEETETSEEQDKSLEVGKSTIRFKDLDIMPETEPWDGPGEKAKATTEDLKLMCTWFDKESPDKKSSYELPHHKAEGHKAVWRGVASAMAKLLGATGGEVVPEDDRKSVYNHLVKHYKQFEKDIPEFKMVENQVLAGLGEELQVLALEREEKHVTRLVKKVLKKQNEQKKRDEQKPDAPSKDHTAQALKIINLALSLYNEDSSKKGGEK